METTWQLADYLDFLPAIPLASLLILLLVRDVLKNRQREKNIAADNARLDAARSERRKQGGY